MEYLKKPVETAPQESLKAWFSTGNALAWKGHWMPQALTELLEWRAFSKKLGVPLVDAPRNCAPWNEKEEEDVACSYVRGESVRAIALKTLRTDGAIISRLQQLGVMPDPVPYGDVVNNTSKRFAFIRPFISGGDAASREADLKKRIETLEEQLTWSVTSTKYLSACEDLAAARRQIAELDHDRHSMQNEKLRADINDRALQKLQDAVRAIYTASFWHSPTLDGYTTRKLWAQLRDAAGIPKGTATALGLAPLKPLPAHGLARDTAAQAWCTPETGHIPMDTRLAEAFAKILDRVWSQPWLGNATTAELLDELTARAEVGGYATYSTTGRERAPNPQAKEKS